MRVDICSTIDQRGIHTKPYAEAAGVPGIAPHDLRRTCAKLCRAGGGELEQIQLLLGHASVQTTERYLGTKQDLGLVVLSGIAFVWLQPFDGPVLDPELGENWIFPRLDGEIDGAAEHALARL